MIQNYDEYRCFIKGLINKVPVLFAVQIELALKNMYSGMTEKVAVDVLSAMQKQNYIYISENGFVVNSLWYTDATNDKFGDDIDRSSESGCYLGKTFTLHKTVEDAKNGPHDETKTVPIYSFIFKNPDYKWLANQIDCMWYVIDNLPESRNFSLNCSYPFTLFFEKGPSAEDSEPVFEVDPDTLEIKTKAPENTESTLVAVAKVPAKSEHAMREAFRLLPPVTDKDLQRAIKRVAVIENRDHAFNIPYVGFKEIIAVNYKNTAKYYDVIETRGDDSAWQDSSE